MKWIQSLFAKKTDPALAGLTSSDKAYRLQRREEIRRLLGGERPKEEIERYLDFLDRWVVHSAVRTVGDDESQRVYHPHAGWDDEWLLTADSFPTEEAARAHVRSFGGRLWDE